MALPLYLAMTAAEISTKTALPRETAYMACHFSPYGTGLSNLPEVFPQGGMVMVNDRIPYWGHDSVLVTEQLARVAEKFQCSCILLDFQRPGIPEIAALAAQVVAALSCPVGVALPYAGELPCPVFLPPVSLDMPLEEYLRPWRGREIWLEAALDAMEFTVTEAGASSAPLPCVNSLAPEHRDDTLLCHYHIKAGDAARFTLYRTWEDLDRLLTRSAGYGVTRAVGLWQELKE